MKSKEYRSRKFLNSKHGLAAIETHCYINDWYMEADVTLSDCNRNISLEFSVWKEKEYAEKAKKLSLIINELLAMQKFMEENKDSFFEARKAKELENKTTKVKSLGQLLGELDD